MQTPVDAPVPPLAHHRLARSWPQYRWWKPLLGLVLSAVIYAVGGFVLILAVLLPQLIQDPDAEFPAELDFYDPWGFTLSFGTIALMLPAVLLGFRLAGCRPIGLLLSVAGRLRWTLMGRCLVPAVVVTAGMAAVSTWTQLGVGGAREVGLQVPWPMLLLALVLVPMQAAAEEYVFRGALMQTLGAWLKHPGWAILLPVPFFLLGHDYDLPGQVGIGVFAVATAWITWRTGGLEAAIVLHGVNNLGVCLLGFCGIGDLAAMEVSWPVALADAAAVVTFVLWVDGRRRTGRLRASTLRSS